MQSRLANAAQKPVFGIFGALLMLALTACGDAAGTACDIKGSGFTASHNCRHKCLQYWQVQCPDGREVTPGVCTGRQTCQPGGCPSGQLCYHFNDPFNEVSYCIRDDVCGAPPDAQARLNWEGAAKVRAAETRAKQLQRFPANGKTTSPALPLAQ